jgi:hypothetical protein
MRLVSISFASAVRRPPNPLIRDGSLLPTSCQLLSALPEVCGVRRWPKTRQQVDHVAYKMGEHNEIQ